VAEQITTAVELDALPVGSVVVNTYGSAWQKNGRNWYRAGASGGRNLAPFPPFVVVYRPDRDLLGEARAEGAREALLSAADEFTEKWADAFDKAHTVPTIGQAAGWRRKAKDAEAVARTLRARAEQAGGAS
jgi:hypothetical protein